MFLLTLYVLTISLAGVASTHTYCTHWCAGRGSSEYVSPDYQRAGERSLNTHCCKWLAAEDFTTIVSNLNTSHSNVTLTTNLNLSRIQSLKNLIVSWDGPLIAVIYDTDYIERSSERTDRGSIHIAKKLRKLRHALRDFHYENLLVVAYIASYDTDAAVFEKLNVIYSDSSAKVLPIFPINALRNVGNDLASTKFVFQVDVDFVPSQSLSRAINTWFERNDPRDVLVIPHWELSELYLLGKRTVNMSDFPVTFAALREGLAKGYYQPFHSRLSSFNISVPRVSTGTEPPVGNPSGVLLSRYGKWLKGECSQALPDTFSMTAIYNWEPFVALCKECAALRYNELFAGRILNKVSYISALRMGGARFYTLPEHFLFHFNHKPSEMSWLLRRQLPDYRLRMETALREMILVRDGIDVPPRTPTATSSFSTVLVAGVLALVVAGTAWRVVGRRKRKLF